jgi:hypothetical protein
MADPTYPDPSWSVERLQWELRSLDEDDAIDARKYDDLISDALDYERRDAWIAAHLQGVEYRRLKREAVRRRLAELKG